MGLVDAAAIVAVAIVVITELIVAAKITQQYIGKAEIAWNI